MQPKEPTNLFLNQVAADGDPERLVPIPDSDHHVRLVDHAFSQICNMVNDISVRVRTKAASLLGNMTSVSERFLAQTLDKKLMSNMRVCVSALFNVMTDFGVIIIADILLL